MGNVNNTLADTVGRMLKTFSEAYQCHQKTANVYTSYELSFITYY